MKTKRRALAVSLSVLMGGILVISGCSITGSISPDYPSYDGLGSLTSDADLIVEVEIGSHREEILLPTYDGDDPRENPYAGTKERPDLDDAGVPIMVYEATIVKVHSGDVKVGDVIEVKEVGGNLDGTRFSNPDVASMKGNSSALLFLATFDDSPASILGGDAGLFFETSDGMFESADEEARLVVSEIDGKLVSE